MLVYWCTCKGHSNAAACHSAHMAVGLSFVGWVLSISMVPARFVCPVCVCVRVRAWVCVGGCVRVCALVVSVRGRGV